MAEVNRPRGPVELIVVALTAEPDGSIASAIAAKVEAGIIKILDLLYIRLSEDGELIVVEADDIGGELEVFGFEANLPGLIGEEDARAVGETLPPGTAVALLAWENVWAAEIAQAIRHAGGELLAHERVPAADVEAVLAALETTE
jgi:hypothetical protein